MSFKNLRVERIELRDALLKSYPTQKRGHVKIGEKKWFLPYKYVEIGSKIYNFETRPDDTWIVTYPRSGTTVTQELVWLVANDMNFEEALRRPLKDRFPFIDLDAIIDDHMYTIDLVQNQSAPRFIKSHMPFDLLPTVVNSDCKIIYVARNPRDVIISWYNFQKDMEVYQYRGTLEQFCDQFMSNHTIYEPYWEHIKEAWAVRHRKNLLFLFCEDLIKDLSGIIEKVIAFFGKTYSDKQIAKLVDHLKIENFRKNYMVNQASISSAIKPEAFIRQGKVGGWKEVFTAEIEEKVSKWIAHNTKDTDLTFPD
ncbi:sulfotransferase 4A1-like [Temnothorax nylanderi]|uniref:sulfotransferase 4A1-like n=1 Tax=Temnothorax nylanderi TaxID=102681 RepID=UPI003A8858B3